MLPGRENLAGLGNVSIHKIAGVIEMRKIILPVAMLVMVMAGFFGCSGVKVSQDYRKGDDFSGIISFAWASDIQEKTGNVQADSPLMDERIREAVERVLIAKGIGKADRTGADILVKYQLEIRQKVKSDDVRGGFGFGYGTYGRGGGIVIGTGGDVQTYEEALLIIDLLRPQGSDLLWRGIATYRLTPHSSPEKATALVNEAVEKTFAQFPPDPDSG